MFKTITLKSLVLIFSTTLFLFVGSTCFAQSKSKTLEWINTQGKEIIKQITGNTSVHWELDGYGSFRITDYNPETESGGEKKLAKRYTYLNLYELDIQATSIKKKRENPDTEVLVLSCREEKNACIKVRDDYEDTSLKTKAVPQFLFEMKEGFDHKKGEKLAEMLRHAIDFFQGGSSS